MKSKTCYVGTGTFDLQNGFELNARILQLSHQEDSNSKHSYAYSFATCSPSS